MAAAFRQCLFVCIALSFHPSATHFRSTRLVDAQTAQTASRRNFPTNFDTFTTETTSSRTRRATSQSANLERQSRTPDTFTLDSPTRSDTQTTILKTQTTLETQPTSTTHTATLGMQTTNFESRIVGNQIAILNAQTTEFDSEILGVNLGTSEEQRTVSDGGNSKKTALGKPETSTPIATLTTSATQDALKVETTKAASLENVTLTPLERYKIHDDAVREFRCKTPQKRAIQIREELGMNLTLSEDPNPWMTVLYRCDQSSGCCPKGKKCGPKMKEKVNLTIIITKNSRDSKFQDFEFDNHTSCSCYSIIK